VNGLLDFDRRTIVVTGAASGIGAAAVDGFLAAGADVHAVDVAPIGDVATDAGAHEHRCDLGDVASIDASMERLPSSIDVLVNSAGVPNGGRFSMAEVMAVNWLGLRHLTELVLPRMPSGSAVVHVASTAGRDWAAHRPELTELMAEESFESGAAWVANHPDTCGDGYSFSKEAVQWYTMQRSLETAPVGIRMNSICPGVTNTGLVDDFRRGFGADVLDRATAIAGRMAEPAEMAPALLFLADDASSSFVNGLNLVIDGGSAAARSTAGG
jgi:NAD(P)-dependent dehydrogenase (short-subunit alcohol dehydrogenase family)